MKTISKKWILLMLSAVFMIGHTEARSRKAPLSQAEINWTPIDKAVDAAKSANKKFILVDLYTDWCGWCKKMDENTLTDPGIIASLNDNFTTVRFNAEIKEPVVFNGKTYSFTQTGARGANQLALDLGTVGGKLGYPTLVVLDANGNKIQTFPGYKDVETLNTIINYFKTGVYKTMDFQQFQSGQ